MIFRATGNMSFQRSKLENTWVFCREKKIQLFTLIFPFQILMPEICPDFFILHLHLLHLHFMNNILLYNDIKVIVGYFVPE